MRDKTSKMEAEEKEKRGQLKIRLGVEKLETIRLHFSMVTIFLGHIYPEDSPGFQKVVDVLRMRGLFCRINEPGKEEKRNIKLTWVTRDNCIQFLLLI